MAKKFTVLEITDLDARILRVVKGRAGLSLEAALSVSFADLPRDEAGVELRGARLRDYVRANKIPAGPCALVFPKQNAIVRTVRLPSSNPDELREMALFEAEKFIPFNVERHIISAGILRLGDVEGSEVLVAAVDGPVMESTLETASAAGFEPVVADISSVALARSFMMNTEPVEDGTSALVLFIGRAHTDIVVIQDGLLISTRSQAFGTGRLRYDMKDAMHLDREISDPELASFDFRNSDEFLLDGGVTSESGADSGHTKVGDAARDWLNRTVRFVKQSHDFAAREHQLAPASIVFLSGDGHGINGLPESLHSMLGLKVVPFAPLEKLPKAKNARVEEALLPDLSEAIGGILRQIDEDENPATKADRVNLLPPQFIEKQEAAERQILLMISGVMVLLTVIFVYLAVDMRNDHKLQLLDRYDEFNEEMEPLVEELQDKEKKLEIIGRITTDRASAMLILDEVSKYPQLGPTSKQGRLTLTGFKYSASDEVRFSGTALEIEDVNKFTNYLENLANGESGQLVFSSVEIPDIKPRDLSKNRPRVWEFTVQATLKETSRRGGRRS